jgi:ribosomal protein S18 acetylase RimI-like enzyme
MMQDAPTIEIIEATAVDAGLLEAFNRLVPQLSPGAPVLKSEDLADIVGSEASTILMAHNRQSGLLVGTLTLVIFRIPSGVRARIEDVIVDESVRHQGIGELLSREAIRRAAQRGVRSIDLTSSPEREAANRLYRRLGFKLRSTNVYRYTLETTKS